MRVEDVDGLSLAPEPVGERDFRPQAVPVRLDVGGDHDALRAPEEIVGGPARAAQVPAHGASTSGAHPSSGRMSTSAPAGRSPTPRGPIASPSAAARPARIADP